MGFLLLGALRDERAKVGSQDYFPSGGLGHLDQTDLISQWIADHRGVFPPKQQSGYRRHSRTAASLRDVVSMLEQERHDEEALDGMGVVGRLRSYVQAFLAGRALRVKVGRATSSPRDVRSRVLQGSVLSPFLFNLVLAPLPDCTAAGVRYTVGIAVYVDDVAICMHGPTRQLSKMKAVLQEVLGAVADFLRSRDLHLSEAKTKAMMVKYLGLLIDCRLTWIPEVRALQQRTIGVQRGVRRLLARGQGCSLSVALRVFHGMASSAVLHALPREVAALPQDEAAGLLQFYTAGAACTAMAAVEAGRDAPCCRPAPGEGQPDTGAVILTDSRPALLRLRAADQPSNSSGYVERSREAKLHLVESRGCDLRLYWLPSHVGITGNEVAGALARGASANQEGVPGSRNLWPFDAAQPILARELESVADSTVKKSHMSVANGVVTTVISRFQ
ncbi:uncharacterized protein LOC144139784 [Haemaphysalis longicornis]